jgi:hypothetical protein
MIKFSKLFFTSILSHAILVLLQVLLGLTSPLSLILKLKPLTTMSPSDMDWPSGDVDGDKKPDILMADKTQFVWYRNPDWKRFVMMTA